MTELQPARAPGHDPVVTEIVRNGLVAATEEMKSNLMRTAYNMIIYEALDFTVGLFDAQGDTVSIGIGLPMFIRGMSNTVKRMITQFGLDGIDEGDVLLTNDAYITGSHLNHMTFVVPVFWEGRIVAFSACMAHWQDIGGTLDGMTTDIYSEGLQVPIVKAFRRGEPNAELMSIIRMNVRLPERAMGDLRAQIAAVRTGQKRFLELLAKYGCEGVLASIQAIFAQSEAAAREQVRAIPDGVYEAESFMDDDGIALGTRIPIRVRVIVAGDEMVIDLSGVSEQVRGFYNSGEAAGIACAQVAFKCLNAALELPINDGCFRPLKVILPPGKVVNAVRPAPMRWWMTFPMTVVDTVFKALAPAVPERVIAGHHADLVIGMIHGQRAHSREFFLCLGGLIGGGWGAKHNEDGMNATICINDGDTHNAPSEQIEAKFPLLVEHYGLRADSGGAGRQRGGLGTEQRVRALSDIMLNTQIERVDCRPWGLFGGLSALGNEVALERRGEAESVHPSGKLFAQLLRPGDAYILRSGGGGGFGHPTERPLPAVEEDVRMGYVTPAAARACYGVVFDAHAGQADPAASERLRAQMRSLGLPKDEPLRSTDPQAAPPAHPPRHRRASRRAQSLASAVRRAGLFPYKCC